MDILRDKEGRSNIRLIILVFVVLSGIAAALLYFPPIPTRTEGEITRGEITFTDSKGNPLSGAIELSGADKEGNKISSGLQPNRNLVSWNGIYNARIYYNASDTKSISVNLRISGDSPKGRVILENYGANKPGSVNVSAPGIPIKYVEISAFGVSFVEASISIQYTDAELNGIDKNNLTIYKYDSVTETWSELSASLDAANNILSATVDSLSFFAVSTRIPEKIEVHDTGKNPVVSEVRTYDETRNVKKAERTSVLSTLDVPDRGELEVDALDSKNVAVKLKVNKANKGEVILDDFGKNNPVSVPLQGKVVKYVEIGASGISFSSADITIRYTDADLNGGSEDALTIYHWNGASWDAVPTTIDKANKTLSASTASLSLWGVATLYRQALRCDATTSIGADTTNFTCTTASAPYDIGLLLDNTGGISTVIRIGTAGNGPWIYAVFVNNTAFSSPVNVTGYSASISMRVTTSGRTDYGWYQLGYYDPNGAAGNFVGLFNSTAASTTATAQTAYAISFSGKSAVIPAGKKLAVRVWTNATGGTDRPYFYSFSTAAAANSSFDISIAYPNSTISGYVTNASSGLPLSGATVQTNTSLTTTTDATGYYILTGLSNGTYIVTATHDEYEDNSTTKTINGADVNNWNISLVPDIEPVEGYVLHAPSAYIEARNSSDNLISSTSGTYYNYQIPNRGSLLVDANSTDEAAVKFTIIGPSTASTVTLQDYGISNPVGSAPPGKNIKYVEIGATGMNFSSAVVKIYYTPAELGSADEGALAIYHWNGASWEALPTTVDVVNHILTATTTSLSPFAASAGTGGPNKILVATNRYVVLDDWQTGTASTNYVVPNTADVTTSDFFTGKQTTIGVKTLLIDANGTPLSGKTVNFTIYNPNNAVYSTGTNVTDPYGVASYYKDMNNANYWGNWTVKADYSGISGNSSFIYNWWGCAWGGSCTGGHAGVSPESAGISPPTSPYTKSDEKITSWQTQHYPPGITGIWGDNWCTICHQNYDGNTTPTNTVGTVKGWYPRDVHNKIRCDNASCHDPGTNFANHNAGTINISSCTSASCHPLRNDISMKTTLNGVVSNYSNATAGSTYDDYHTPNFTVPCIICHGPMHNVTKPDPTNVGRDNNTESSQCTPCHSSYSMHNNSVNCTLCHSDDAHFIQVFAQNATYITLNKYNPNPARGNCTSCHQNSTFYGILKSQPNATLQTGRDPPQVPSPMEHSNDPNAGQKWNQTPGYWNNSQQLTWCKYCHGETNHKTSALGRPSLWDGNNTVNSTIGNTTWCASCHWQSYVNGTNTSNDMVNTFAGDSLLIPPEITGNATYGANRSIYEYTNHSLYTSFYPNLNDSSCNRCHGYQYGFTTITQLMHNLSRVGGANCADCHDIGGIVLLSHVNVTTANDTSAIHKNLNSNATHVLNTSIYYNNNLRCWACHWNGSEPSIPNAHPTNYTTPYRCPDCHIQSASQNLNFTPNTTLLNVSQHYNFTNTSITTTVNITVPNITSCYDCHNKTEMMLLAYLPDNYSTGIVYGGANGHNNSTSHYGKKRADLRSWDSNSSDNCSYCHQNTSTAFITAMADPNWNASIANHSTNYNSTNPGCTNSTCHSTGWIHNITLAKPVSNDSLCKICHGIGGSATKNNKSEHKNLYCTECHANSTNGSIAGKDIHPIKYLTKSNNFSTSNSSAVDCTTCHQTSNVDSSLTGFTAFKIMNPLHHSSNISNGSVWGSYWTNTTPLTACIYCHNDTKHNATPLGRTLSWAPNYVLYGSIGTNTSCTNCHYKGDSNYSQMNSTFVSAGRPIPPEITNGTNWNGTFSNYYNHSLSNYTDQDCKACHGSLLSGSANMSEFQHNVAIGVAGGPNCISCHDIGGSAGAGRLVNISAMNDTNAIHKNLNSNATSPSGYPSADFRCWACHGNGSEPASGGHPSNYTKPYRCPDCHVPAAGQNLNYTPNNTLLNVSNHYWNGTNITTSNVTSCYSCHNRTEMMVGTNLDPDGPASVYGGANGGNNSTSHYGKKRTDMAVMDNTTYCSYCHNTSTNNATFYVSDFNNTMINHTSRATTPLCSNCHNTGRIHNSTLAKPVSNDTLCKTCHGTGGSAATNNKSEHRNLYCTECHANSTNGTLAGKDIHGIKYLLQNNTFSTTNISAVNCTTCHQTTTVDSSLGVFAPPKIVNPLHHSDKPSNGSLWNGTQPVYWTNTSPQTACIYCHNDTKHNATPLGRILQWSPNYVLYGSIGSNASCADCHYKGDSNYTQMNTTFVSAGLSIPPEITNGTNWNGNANYYNHSLINYTDAACKLCHGLRLNASANMSEFMHNVTNNMTGICTDCHYSFTTMNTTTRPDRYVNSTMFNSSPHGSVSCENCHTKGHRNIGARKACEDCHAVQQIPITDRDRHNITAKPSLYMYNGTSVVNITTCTTCHDATLYSNATSTYGYGKTYDCDYCHTYPDKTYS